MSEVPNGCAHCGKDKREHAIEHAGGVGFHIYVAPDTETIKARMKARRENSDAS